MPFSAANALFATWRQQAEVSGPARTTRGVRFGIGDSGHTAAALGAYERGRFVQQVSEQLSFVDLGDGSASFGKHRCRRIELDRFVLGRVVAEEFGAFV